MTVEEYNSAIDGDLLIKASALSTAFSRYHEKYIQSLPEYLTSGEAISMIAGIIGNTVTPTGEPTRWATENYVENLTIGDLDD